MRAVSVAVTRYESGVPPTIPVVWAALKLTAKCVVGEPEAGLTET